MASRIGIWLLIASLFCTSLFGSVSLQKLGLQDNFANQHSLLIDQLFKDERLIKTHLFSTFELSPQYLSAQPIKLFDVAELNILIPYLPHAKDYQSNRSQASLNLNLPQEWGGLILQGGVSYQLDVFQNSKTATPKERLVYFVSTKNLAENKWMPFVSISYMRSEVRNLSKSRYRVFENGRPSQFSSQARYANTEALGTCCGIKPHENLYVVLSYNYLKPLQRGAKLSNQHSKMFDDLRASNYSQGVDFKLDYAVREGVNFLVKSEYLIPKGTIRDMASDTPVLIEGQLIVSF